MRALSVRGITSTGTFSHLEALFHNNKYSIDPAKGRLFRFDKELFGRNYSRGVVMYIGYVKRRKLHELVWEHVHQRELEWNQKILHKDGNQRNNGIHNLAHSCAGAYVHSLHTKQPLRKEGAPLIYLENVPIEHNH